MNNIYPFRAFRQITALVMLLAGYLFTPLPVAAQTCPGNVKTNLSTYPNTYYPGNQSTVAAGSKSIVLGGVSIGSTPIAVGDMLLIIQMQGSQITTADGSTYGDGSTGSGYLNNASLLAGNMEYVVAASAVPTSGGTLTVSSGFINSYQNSNFGTTGQYRYQVIRVPVYYNVNLTANITAPAWNGTTGGVVVIDAVDSLIFNGYTIDASSAGFRGAAGRKLNGASGPSSTDYVTMSTLNANGGKGEGIAGTPRYISFGGSLIDNGATNEGYVNGSSARGAPGNAGGGGTDGNPGANTENTGGGGGANGGAAGRGGNAWSQPTLADGGLGGSPFSQVSPSRFVMGGGGGSGTTNDGTGSPGNGLASSGASGGGIVIVMANAIGGTGTINVNGQNANNTVLNDGSGGGGAGGTALIYIATGSLTNLTVTANGGTGGTNTGLGAQHGPGGGGGGGVIYANNTLNASSSASGGANGTTAGGVAYGSVAGSNGILTQNITQTQMALFPSVCTILPVEFISVSAQNNNGMVNVAWEVTEEADVQEYQVERSADGSNFTVVGSVPYKTANESINLYNFTDNAGLSAGNTLYYRIKGVDQSGNPLYSKTVVVTITGKSFNHALSVAPNPVVGSATISFTCSAAGLINLRLIDMGGRTVWQREFEASEGQNSLALDNPAGFTNGVYSLQWSDGVKIQQTKILIHH